MPDLSPIRAWLESVTTDKVVIATDDLRQLVAVAEQAPLPTAPALGAAA